MSPLDIKLRLFSFVGAAIGALLLMTLNWVKIRAKQLTTGEIIVREGFVALLISVIYGTGEQLWSWYHLRTWILAVAVLWTVVGLLWMTVEIFRGRTRHNRPSH